MQTPAAGDSGLHTQAPPAASPGTADTAEEAPCPQATQQPEAEGCAVRAPGGTRHTNARGQATTGTTNGPQDVLHEKRAVGATDGARPPQFAAAGERVHPDAAMSQARAGTHDNPPLGAPETEDILASIFNAAAATEDQLRQADWHLHDDESLAVFMASCRDKAQTTGPMTTSALRRVSHDRELTSPGRDPASTCHQAHLCRNYAALGSAPETHATTAGDGQAAGQPEGVASQRPGAQDAPIYGVRTPAETGTVSGPVEGVPPRMTQPWGQGSLDYAQSEGEAQRPNAEADCVAAGNLDLWIPQISYLEQLTIHVRTWWILMDVHHIRMGACTMADVIFNLPEVRHFPPPTMENPGHWRYMATSLMAQMEAHTPDDLNRLHWRWHHRAAFRIREALTRHNVWTIRTLLPRGPPTPDRTTGQQR